MSTASGPVIPRKRLAAELRRLRIEAGMNLEDVAKQLMISTSKLSRLENAQGSPQRRDVRDLINLYGIQGTDLAGQLDRWVGAARRQGWWVGYSSGLRADATGDQLEEHLSYEADALVARVYTIQIPPVLLQTDDYARAFYRSTEPWLSADEVEQLVAVRRGRQHALHEREALPALQLIAIAHEASLRQRVGSAEIMRDQLRAIIDRSKLPNVEFRVLTSDQLPGFTSQCPHALFEFGPDVNEVLRIETPAGFRHIETPKTVGRWRAHHEEMRRKARGPEESRDYIQTVLASSRSKGDDHAEG